MTEPNDIPGGIALCRSVYAEALPWTEVQLRSHEEVSPEGPLFAVDDAGGLLASAACSIVNWDDGDAGNDWRDSTDKGFVTNHDPDSRGRAALIEWYSPDVQPPAERPPRDSRLVRPDAAGPPAAGS